LNIISTSIYPKEIPVAGKKWFGFAAVVAAIGAAAAVVVAKSKSAGDKAAETMEAAKDAVSKKKDAVSQKIGKKPVTESADSSDDESDGPSATK
jgi:hypothetical protein